MGFRGKMGFRGVGLTVSLDQEVCCWYRYQLFFDSSRSVTHLIINVCFCPFSIILMQIHVL